MTIKDRQEMLRLIHNTKSLSEMLIQLRKLDKHDELSIGEHVIDKNELYELIKKVKTKTELDKLLAGINEKDFAENYYFYIYNSDAYPPEMFRNVVGDSISDDLGNYFNVLEKINEAQNKDK